MVSGNRVTSNKMQAELCIICCALLTLPDALALGQYSDYTPFRPFERC